MKLFLPILTVISLIVLVGCPNRITNQLRFASAAARGDAALVDELLKNSDVDINGINGVIGPALSSASYGGHVEVVNTLLLNGANVNLRDGRSITPLMDAVMGQNEAIVSILLEKGADPNMVVLDNNNNETSITALSIAKMKGNQRITDILEGASKSTP